MELIVQAIGLWTLPVLGGVLIFRLARVPDFSVTVSATLGAIIGIGFLQQGVSSVLVIVLASLGGVMVALVFCLGVFVCRCNALIFSIAILLSGYAVELLVLSRLALNTALGELSTRLNISESVEASLPLWASSPDGRLLFALGTALLTILFFRTHVGAKIRLASDLGPAASDVGLHWSSAAAAIVIAGHVLFALGGLLVAISENAIAINRFDTYLFYVLSAVAMGELSLAIARRGYRFLPSKRLESFYRAILRRMGFAGMAEWVVIVLIGAVLIESTKQLPLKIPFFTAWGSAGVGASLALLLFLGLMFGARKLDMDDWKFRA